MHYYDSDHDHESGSDLEDFSDFEEHERPHFVEDLDLTHTVVEPVEHIVHHVMEP